MYIFIDIIWRIRVKFEQGRLMLNVVVKIASYYCDKTCFFLSFVMLGIDNIAKTYKSWVIRLAW